MFRLGCVPIRKATHPSLTRLGVRKYTFEGHLDVYSRSRRAWQSNFHELFLQIGRNHVRPLDAVLSRIVGAFVSQPRLVMHTIRKWMNKTN